MSNKKLFVVVALLIVLMFSPALLFYTVQRVTPGMPPMSLDDLMIMPALIAIFFGLAMLRLAMGTRATIVSVRGKWLTLQRRFGRPVVMHRIATIQSVEGVEGHLSIRLLNGRGWLDNTENLSVYWDVPMRKDELDWVVVTLQRALGLIPRDGEAPSLPAQARVRGAAPVSLAT